MPDEAAVRTDVQLCGTFAAVLTGRRIDHRLPGRQGRLLFSALVLSRFQPISRDGLADAIWGDSPPGNVSAALNALISKTRVAVGSDVLRGRTMLSLALPEPVRVDVEVAQSGLHEAESAVALSDWRRAWPSSLTALFVARRTFLPEAASEWAEVWRRRLADVRIRALECYARTCLELGGTELFGAERAGRELVEVAPFRESGHLLLIRTLAARGSLAEALAAYERLRVLLRDELGVSPSPAVQEMYAQLLG